MFSIGATRACATASANNRIAFGRTVVFFVNGDMAGSLDHTLSADDEVMIVAALSGG